VNVRKKSKTCKTVSLEPWEAVKAVIPGVAAGGGIATNGKKTVT
jgi:hypothetical protein